MRLLGLLIAAVLLLAGCGDDTAAPAPSPSPSPDSSSPTPLVPKPGGDTPEGQPPADGPLPDTRTGAVDLGGPCPEDYAANQVAARDLAVDGTVTAIDDGRVTFDVHGTGESVTVDMAPPVPSRRSDTAPSYSVGTRLLVSGDDGTAWGCGWTRYYDEETAADWRS